MIALIPLSMAGESFGEKKARQQRELKSAQLAQQVLDKAEREYLSYRFGTQTFEILRNRKKGITISSYCGDNLEDFQKKKECQALSKLAQADLRPFTSKDFDGGRNPGSVVCTKQLDGQVIYATDSRGNVQTFCHFKDGSMLRSDSIDYFASKKIPPEAKEIEENVDIKKMDAVLDANEESEKGN